MKKYLSLIFLAILSSQGFAWSLTGSYENDFAAILRKDKTMAIGDVNRLRMKFDNDFNENIRAHLEPRYYILPLKNENLLLAGVTDINQVVWDKYYLKFDYPIAAMTVGKQRIAWGTGNIWNPTDAINPFYFNFAVTKDDETNVDALRLEKSIGLAGGVDAYVLNNSPKKGIRIKSHAGLFDMSVDYVDRGNSASQIGFDFVGEVFGVGVRGESAFRYSSSQEAVPSFILGGDYTLENGIGLNMEYFYNGFGKNDKNNYDWPGLLAGSISNLGRDYLYLGTNKVIDEITEVQASLIINLDDSSLLIYPSYKRNVLQNVDVSLESMLMFGPDDTEFNPLPAHDPTGFGGSKLGLIRIIWNF